MRVELSVSDDLGKIGITLEENLYRDFCDDHQVAEASQLPETVLRELCHQFSPKDIEKLETEIEADNPEAGELRWKTDGGLISSTDVGHDMMRRLMPSISEADELLLNPDYAEVQFEFKVLRALGSVVETQVVLATTLKPPDLAG